MTPLRREFQYPIRYGSSDNDRDYRDIFNHGKIFRLYVDRSHPAILIIGGSNTE